MLRVDVPMAVSCGITCFEMLHVKDVVDGSVWLAEAALWTNWSFGHIWLEVGSQCGSILQLHQTAPKLHLAFNGNRDTYISISTCHVQSSPSLFLKDGASAEAN